MELAYRERRLGETDVFARTWLPLLERGGVGLQVCPIYVDVTVQPEGSLREALSMAASFHRAVRENAGKVTQVCGPEDLDAVEAGERIGLVLALEGVECFGVETWPADVFHQLGVRMAGPDVEPSECVRGRGRRGGRRPLAAGARARRPSRRPRSDPRRRTRVTGPVHRGHRARRRSAGRLLARGLQGRLRHAAEPRRRPAAGARRRERPVRADAPSDRDRPRAADDRRRRRPSRARSVDDRDRPGLPRWRLHATSVGGDAASARAEGRAHAARAHSGPRHRGAGRLRGLPGARRRRSTAAAGAPQTSPPSRAATCFVSCARRSDGVRARRRRAARRSGRARRSCAPVPAHPHARGAPERRPRSRPPCSRARAGTNSPARRRGPP